MTEGFGSLKLLKTLENWAPGNVIQFRGKEIMKIAFQKSFKENQLTLCRQSP